MRPGDSCAGHPRRAANPLAPRRSRALLDRQAQRAQRAAFLCTRTTVVSSSPWIAPGYQGECRGPSFFGNQRCRRVSGPSQQHELLNCQLWLRLGRLSLGHAYWPRHHRGGRPRTSVARGKRQLATTTLPRLFLRSAAGVQNFLAPAASPLREGAVASEVSCPQFTQVRAQSPGIFFIRAASSCSPSVFTSAG